MYFHEYKTSLLSPGNQSKTADDIDMLREKISVHRVVGGAVSSAGVLPTDTHWLESVWYDARYRSLNITLPAGDNLTDESSKILLRAYYSGTGSTTAGDGQFVVTFNSGTDDVNYALVDGGNEMIVYYDTSDTNVEVATKFKNALNDLSPYHSAEVDTTTPQVVKVTYLQPGRSWQDAEGSLFFNGSVGAQDPADTATEMVVYEEVNKEDVMYIQSNKKLNPTKHSRGIYYKQSANSISIIPDPGVAISCDYIKKPAKPNWGYVVVNDKALYNSNTSTDFDLHTSEESTLTNKILELAGIVINKPGLSEVILRNEAVKEANENK
jgi:hypothetical protein